MFSSKTHEQTIIEFSQGDFIAITAESFLIDRKSAGLSQHTLKFYRQFLNPFIAYCNVTALKLIGEISPDILRRYFLVFAETHNPGGVHAAYRTLRAFFHWPAKFVIHSDANASLKGYPKTGMRAYARIPVFGLLLFVS